VLLPVLVNKDIYSNAWYSSAAPTAPQTLRKGNLICRICTKQAA